MKSPIEQSPEHIQWLGIIAARWARLDNVLFRLIWEAVPSYEMANAIYFSSSAQTLRFDQVEAIINASDWTDEEKSVMVSCIKQLRRLWKERNTILHSPAVSDAKRTYYAKTIKPLRTPPEKKIELTLAKLKNHAERLSAVGDEIFRYAWREEIKSLSDWPQRKP